VASIGGIQNFASNLAGIPTTTVMSLMLTITSGSFVVRLVVAGLFCFLGLCRICSSSAKSNLCLRSIQMNWSDGQSSSVRRWSNSAHRQVPETANIATSVAVCGPHKGVADLRSMLSSGGRAAHGSERMSRRQPDCYFECLIGSIRHG
jgi:hypothetical protein